MNWDDIRIFLAVSKNNSFSKTAKNNNTTQATISRRIQRLEEELGYCLFNRGQEGCSLTPAGEVLISSAREMGVWANVFQDEIARLNAPQKAIVITCGPMLSYLLSTNLDQLKLGVDDTRIEIKATPAYLDLEKREADIAIRNKRPGGNSDAIKIKRLTTTFFTDFSVYGHTNFFPEKTPLTPCVFNDYIWAGYTENLVGLPSAKWLSRYVNNENIHYRLNNSFLMIDVIKHHKVLAVLPRFVAHDTPELTEVYGPIDELSSDLWLARHFGVDDKQIKIVAANVENLLNTKSDT